MLIYYAICKRSLAVWILISMVVGCAVGYSFSEFGTSLRIFSNIFLRLIKCVIAPLLFGTLVCGIAGHANIKTVGRMGLKSIIFFEVVTTLALFIGLFAINLSEAGAGITKNNNVSADEALGKSTTSMKLSPQGVFEAADGLEKASASIDDPQALISAAQGLRLLAREIQANNETVVKSKSGSEIILNAIPENLAKSVAENQVLQVVIFSVIFGIALAQLPEEKRQPMLSVCQSLTDVMFKFTNIIMYMAPLGVGSAIAYTVGNMGFGVLSNLAKLIGTLYVALLFTIVFIFIPIMLLCRINVLGFFRRILEPLTLAFATTSSEAALPKAMEEMERFGVPRHIIAFVLPTGYSFNLVGSTLYLSLATVFVAQAANIPLSFGTQMLIVFTLMLTSKGVAGMPRATLVILLGAAATFNLPEWPILAILGVDELADMARSATNVMGNCLATVVIAKWEGVMGKEKSLDSPETLTPAVPQ